MSDILVVLDPRGAWISPHLISVQYFFRDAEDPPAQETNQHWIGRFTATRHTIRRDLLFHGAWDPPAKETNTHWIGKYTPAVYTLRRDLLWSWAWDPPAAETNPNFIGRFKPTAHSVLSPLRQHQDFQTAFIPPNEANPHWFGTHWQTSFNINLANIQGGDFNQTETNTNFIGRFTATKHTVARHLLHWRPAFDIVFVAQPETNVHSAGRFAPTVHRVLGSLRQHGDFLPPAAETNAHWIGRYTATSYKVLLSSRQNPATDVFVAPQPETNTHFLGTFTPTRHIVNLGNIQGGDFLQAETNPNFIGRFRPYVHTISRHLNVWKSDSDGAVQVAQPETNPHWIGNFTPYVHTINVANIQGGDFNVVETNPHWIGRYKSPPYAILISLRQNPAQDTPFDVETNFIGGFYAPEHRISRQLLFQHGWDTFTPAVQAETNPHFLGTFTPTRHIVNLGAIQGGDFAQTETNPNFLGRFTAQRFTLSRHLNVWKSDSDGAFQAAQPETNPHFLGNFTPYVHTINVANIQGGDFTQAETNPNFIGRFTATKHNVARQLNHFYSAWDTAVTAVSETNPNWLGRFAPTAYKISISARQHGDFQPPTAETNLHTIGRFTPNQIRILPGLRQNPASDFVTAAPAVETNPNFLGKFTPNQIRILPGLRQNPATDFIVGPVVPPTEGAGGERWPRYSWRWCDFTDREWFKAFCEEFYRLKALKSPELRRRQLADLEQALDLAIERAAGGIGEPEWAFDIRAAGGMLQDEAGSPDVYDRIAAGLMRLALEIDDEEAFLLLDN